MMDVIPLILSEAAVIKIPEDYLIQLAACSTYVIKEKVKRYLNSAEAKPKAKAIIVRVYAEQIEQEDFLNSGDLKARVELIKEMEYGDVTPSRSVEELEAYKEAIEYILNNKNAIPYIAPIKGDMIIKLREELVRYGKDNNCKEAVELSKLLKVYNTYFRDSQHESYRGTIVKKIVRNRGKYETILHGLDFMLDKKRRRVNPASWRYF